MELRNAREIYNLSKDDIWAMPDGKIVLEFDDGVLETTMRATIFSWYTGVFHRLYPETPLLICHHLGDEIIRKSTHLDLMGRGLFDTIDAYGDRVDREELSRIAYQWTNEIYNDFTTRLKSYVSTISILDFVDVMEHPAIKEANAKVKPTQHSIDHTYKVISQTLSDRNDPTLNRNTLARMAKSGLVSMGQIQQCVGPRGFLTDIDSNIFRHPILTGYTEGICNLADSMMESRSAAKAYKFAAEKVSDTEYFNREMQLMASVVSRIHQGDCGTQQYVPFRVGAGDLSRIEGKYYVDDNNQLKEVMANDRFLIGNVINLRSVLKCKHSDAYGVCSTCMGKIADSIPNRSNVGHVAATIIGEKISQNVLSTKHLDGSSKVDEFELTAFDRKFIRVATEVNSDEESGDNVTVIKIAERLAGQKVKLILPEGQVKNLSDIDYHEVGKLVPSMVTKLKEVMMTIEDKEGYSETVTLPVSMGSRLSWLTHDALMYIKTIGWTLSEKGNYVVDLSKWDNDTPLFQLPLKHTDMTQYMNTIKSFVMKTGKKVKGEVPTVERTLIEFYNLISSKLNINIAHLEVLMLASMVKSVENKDHRLPTPVYEGALSSYRDNMKLRSMGPSMAYQGQGKLLTSVQSFIFDKRPDSIFDNLLCPYSVVNPRE